MPVHISKTSGGKYRVSTPNGVHAKHTTKKNAERQRNLLNAVDHGWKPTGKPARESLEAAQEIVDELLS
jgi:ribosomal protein S30